MPDGLPEDNDKSKRNLIDKAAIEAYLDSFHNDPKVRTLLRQALLPALSKRPENLAEVREMPLDAPQWLKEKWPEGGPYHRFKPDSELGDKVRHAADRPGKCTRSLEFPVISRTVLTTHKTKSYRMNGYDSHFRDASKIRERS